MRHDVRSVSPRSPHVRQLRSPVNPFVNFRDDVTGDEPDNDVEPGEEQTRAAVVDRYFDWCKMDAFTAYADGTEVAANLYVTEDDGTRLKNNRDMLTISVAVDVVHGLQREL